MENIYVEMDGLFDTRISMLSSINEDIAIEEFNKRYKYRTSDTFGLIPYSVFQAYYNIRSKHILLYSLPSFIYKVIENVTLDFYSDLKNKEIDLQTLYVNTYPYDFNQEELDKFKITFESYIKNVKVEFIHFSDYDLTPKILDDFNIKNIIKYNGIDWLEKQNRLLNIIENPMVNKNLYVPAVINFKLGCKVNREVFESLTKSLAVVINVFFTDIEYWNMIEKNKRK